MSRLEQSGQRLGPCAVLCFSQEHRPCERTSAGSAGLTTGPSGAGQQDRRGSSGRQKPGVGSLRTTRHNQEPACPVLQSAPVGDMPGPSSS